MRSVINPQLMLDGVDIGAIFLDPKSRDDIPQLLRGLQHVYTELALRERVFAILQEVIPERVTGQGKADSGTGRPGMEQWRILVLGVVRLGLNADYDRIQELANQHSTLRQMLGHGDWTDKAQYKLQTLKDNLRLFTPEILDRINQEVVGAGHVLAKKSPAEGLAVRCDSFVVETHVHYPTDINLLWDAMRKTIEIAAEQSSTYGLTEWRQSAYNLRQLKKLYRQAQKLKHSSSKDEAKRQDKQASRYTRGASGLSRTSSTLPRSRAGHPGSAGRGGAVRGAAGRTRRVHGSRRATDRPSAPPGTSGPEHSSRGEGLLVVPAAYGVDQQGQSGSSG